MSTPVPPLSAISECTVEWLRKALGDSSIADFTTTRIGTGQVALCYRLALEREEYPGVPAIPPTLVFKLPATDPKSKGIGLAMDLYERETKFYSELAATQPPNSLAKPHYSYFENGTFSLLMKDAVGAVVGDELVGATIEQARSAVRALGDIERLFPLEALLEKAPWVFDREPVPREYFEALTMRFLEEFGGRLEEEEVVVIERLLTRWDAYVELSRESPRGLVHGDFWLGNVLFGEETAVVVDWQTVDVGPVMRDLAMFFGGSICTEERRQYADELTELYLAASGSSMTLSQVRKSVHYFRMGITRWRKIIWLPWEYSCFVPLLCTSVQMHLRKLTYTKYAWQCLLLLEA